MKILVTGGGGFVGLALVRRLVETGHDVSVFSRNFHAGLQKPGIRVFRGDLRNPQEIGQACFGMDAVFHVAAKVGVWGTFKDFYDVNVEGTINVTDACIYHRVEKLIFTSSASVVFNGSDIKGVNESILYPVRPASCYTATKAEAEKIVLKANSESLKTIVLRPHLIWGPGDTQITPGLLKRAKNGRLRRIGSRDCYVDITHIDNLVDAQLLALKKMDENPAVCGKPYFITDGKPVFSWDFINGIIRTAGYPPVEKRVPEAAAFLAARILENVHRLFRLKSEPYITRFLVKELCTHHWFDISAAKNELGYSPREGMNCDDLIHQTPSLLQF